MQNDSASVCYGGAQGFCQGASEGFPGGVQSQRLENLLQVVFCMKAGEHNGSVSRHGIAFTGFIKIQREHSIGGFDGIVEGDGSAVCAGGKFKCPSSAIFESYAVEHRPGQYSFFIILLDVVPPEFNSLIVDNGEITSVMAIDGASKVFG